MNRAQVLGIMAAIIYGSGAVQPSVDEAIDNAADLLEKAEANDREHAEREFQSVKNAPTVSFKGVRP